MTKSKPKVNKKGVYPTPAKYKKEVSDIFSKRRSATKQEIETMESEIFGNFPDHSKKKHNKK